MYKVPLEWTFWFCQTWNSNIVVKKKWRKLLRPEINPDSTGLSLVHALEQSIWVERDEKSKLGSWRLSRGEFLFSAHEVAWCRSWNGVTTSRQLSPSSTMVMGWWDIRSRREQLSEDDQSPRTWFDWLGGLFDRFDPTDESRNLRVLNAVGKMEVGRSQSLNTFGPQPAGMKMSFISRSMDWIWAR
jgi:hypothetical protein